MVSFGTSCYHRVAFDYPHCLYLPFTQVMSPDATIPMSISSSDQPSPVVRLLTSYIRLI
jgi:hypothetical protein